MKKAVRVDGPHLKSQISNPKLFRFFQRRDGLSAREAGVAFVPVTDFVFAEFPAEADIVAAMSAGEVDEAHLVVLQFAADF